MDPQPNFESGDVPTHSNRCHSSDVLPESVIFRGNATGTTSMSLAMIFI